MITMSDNKLHVNDKEYDSVEDFLDKGFYDCPMSHFDDYHEQMYSNNYQGRYNITLEHEGKQIKHTFICISTYYENLKLKPYKIPRINMFNVKEDNLNLNYEYIAYNHGWNNIKRGEVVDFDGSVRKKEEEDEIVKEDNIRYVVESGNFNLKEYLENGFEVIDFDKLDEYSQETIQISEYNLLYVKRLVLVSGEHINLYYYYDKHEGNKIYLKPEYGQERNHYTIPSKYIVDEFFIYSPYSYKIGSENFDRYVTHMTEKANNNFIHVPTNALTDCMDKIRKYGTQGKLRYEFGFRGKTIVEEYEFVKFKKEYHYNLDYVILKTLQLPEFNWYDCELSDIEWDGWFYEL